MDDSNYRLSFWDNEVVEEEEISGQTDDNGSRSRFQSETN
jgi:hypothetical protein